MGSWVWRVGGKLRIPLFVCPLPKEAKGHRALFLPVETVPPHHPAAPFGPVRLVPSESGGPPGRFGPLGLQVETLQGRSGVLSQTSQSEVRLILNKQTLGFQETTHGGSLLLSPDIWPSA